MGTHLQNAARQRLDMNLSQVFDTLETTNLIRRASDPDTAYLFKHALIQDTAYTSLTRAERKHLHRHVAEAYEILYAGHRMDEYAGLLAQHYGEAGDDAQTLAYATRAGDIAAREYANVEAIAFYEQALAAAKRGGATTAQFLHLYTKRGRVYEVMANTAALETYQEMTEFARARGDRALELQALLLCGKLYASPSPLFDRAKALELAGEASVLAHDLGDRLAQAHALWNLQLLYLYNSEIPDSIRCGEQALTLAREVETRELLGFILTDLGRAYLQSGQIAKIAAVEAEAQTIWRELDNKPMLADNLMQTATQTFLRGEYDETIALTNEGLEISRTIDSKISFMSNAGMQVIPMLDRGEITRAFELAEDILRVAHEISGGFNYLLQNALGAWVYASVGALERGTELANEALASLQQPSAEFFRAWAWVSLARYYLARGDVIAARAALTSSQMEIHAGRVDPAAFTGAVALGECLVAEGEYARAAALMKQRVQMLYQLGFRASLYELLFIQAQATRALGQTAEAIELLHAARQVAEEMQARRVLWEIYAALSETENARGNVEQAKAYLAQARAVIEYIVAHSPQEFRESFLNLPRVRAILD